MSISFQSMLMYKKNYSCTRKKQHPKMLFGLANFGAAPRAIMESNR